VPRRSWVALLALASLWGASYLFIKIGLRDLSPELIVFLRTGLAALALAPLALSRGALGWLRGRVGDVAVLALIQVAAPFLLITLGEQSISSSLTGILVASAPIFTALLAIWVDHDERLSGVGVIGTAIGIAGVALVVGVETGDSGLLGALVVVLASLGYAIGGFYIKRRMVGVPPIGLVTATMAASALMTLPLALATLPSEAPGAGPLAAMLALGVGGTGIAFVLFYGLIASVGPTRASLVAYIAPGFAVIYGTTLLDERFTLVTLAGLVLIVGGSWLAAEGRLPVRRRVGARTSAKAPTPVAGRMSD
jgi:drug/metabolite transporter (DMT)-like permease